MTNREKLVELLESHCAVIGDTKCKAAKGEKCSPKDCAGCLADHLIANGVAVNNWRDAKTDPPEEEKPVQCFFVNCQCVGFWTKEKGYKQWFASVGYLYFECESEPDYWQPLPEPPKTREGQTDV